MKKLVTSPVFFIAALLILFNSNAIAIETVRTVVHIVRYSNGEGGISTQTAQEAIDTLNGYFSSTNIKFVIDTIVYIDDDNFANLQVTAIDCRTSEFSRQDMQNSLNIYFVPNLAIGPGITATVPGRACAIRNSAAVSTTLAHEVGHCFGLYHTDEICNGYENVTRTYDPNTICYPNCSTAGDLICDTPAQRNNSGSGVDSCGNSYPTTNPNYGNIMDIQEPRSARTYFTFGQIQKMENTLDYNLSDIIFYVNVLFNNKINNVIQNNTTLHIDGSLVNSGGGKSLLYGIGHTSQTDSEIININFKHHDWDDDFNQFKLVEGFNINKNHLERTANFLHIDPANIKNSMTEVSNSDLGTKQLKDPWWVDQGGNQPDNFRTLSSPNVSAFLNQSGAPNWSPPYYSVKVSSPLNIFVGGQLNRMTKFYFQNWSGTLTTFQYPNNTETAVVFTSSNAVVNANYKGVQLSSSASAYANNGQRKFVRTTDGKLHKVYESLGHVWYEMSSDNGATWDLMNGGKPLDNNGGKLPSIDYHGHEIGIVWQENEYNYAIIQIDCFGGTNPYSGYPKKVFSDPTQSYSSNLNPIIAWDYNGRAIVGWENKNNYIYPKGIVVKYGSLSQFSSLGSSNWTAWDTKVITSTDINSINPTIAVYKGSQSVIYFQLAWEQYNNSYSRYVNYCKVYGDGSNNIQTTSVQNISNGDGMYWNYSPSIIAMSNGGARVCWIGDYDALYGNTYTMFRDPGNSRFWSFGYKAKTCNINISEDNLSYFIVWSESYSGTAFTDNSTLSQIKTLNTTAKDVQLSNGATKNNMYVSAFASTSVPYNFTTSNSMGSYFGPSKVNGFASNKIGRGAVVTDGTAQFNLMLEDVNVDDQAIEFADAERNLVLDNANTLNNYLETKPFELTDNSNFTYSLNTGIVDSINALKSLGKDKFVSFGLELIDNASGKVIGELNSINYSALNLLRNKTEKYSVNTKGIGSKKVKLRIKIETNEKSKFYLVDSYSDHDESEITKTNIKEINYQGSLAVKDYALDQNYPNPFNPTTTINYQLPEDGIVTLKIYDVLGKEVKTLVNEFETKGRYNANFNAENLASGVYIYQLKVNSSKGSDFVSTKKLILMK